MKQDGNLGTSALLHSNKVHFGNSMFDIQRNVSGALGIEEKRF